MTDFMLVMKGNHQSWNGMSAEEKQRIMEKYYAFVNRLKRENRFKGGSALKHGGVQLYSEKGIVIVDGPYTETKEALNGYFVFAAENQEEAVAIARDCPALTHGEKVEIFEMGSSTDSNWHELPQSFGRRRRSFPLPPTSGHCLLSRVGSLL